METVWKYPIKIQDSFGIEMPEDARVIGVYIRNNIPHICAIVEPGKVQETRRFLLVGVDENIDGSGLVHITVVQLSDKTLDLFEIKKLEV